MVHRVDEALDAYRSAEEQSPEDCKPAYGAGLALHRLGRLEDAEAAYVRAVQRCPRYSEAVTEFAELRLDQPRYEDALKLCHAEPAEFLDLAYGDNAGALPRQKSNRSESEAASILWTVRRVLYSVRTDRRSPPVHRRRGSRRCRVNLHGSAARAGEAQQEVFGSLVNQVVTARNLDLLRRCQLPLGSVVEAGGRRHQGPGWTEITPNSLISSTGMTPDTTPASSATIIECQ